MNPQPLRAFGGAAATKSLLINALRTYFEAAAQRFEPGTVEWTLTPPSGTLTGMMAMTDGAKAYEEVTGIPAALGLTHEALFCSAQRMHHDSDGNARIETPDWLRPHLTGWLDSIEPGRSLERALTLFQQRCADGLLGGQVPGGELGETARAIVARWRALLCSLLNNEPQDATTWAALRQACAQAVGARPFDQAVLTLVETVAWPDDDDADEWLRGWALFLADAPRAGLEADLEPDLAALYLASQSAWDELHARAEREPDFDPYRHTDSQPAIVAAEDPVVARRVDEAVARRARPMIEALFEAFTQSLREAQAHELAPAPARAAPVAAGGRGLIDLPIGQFDAEVLQASGLVLVDFWAEWCAPCKQFMPTLGALVRQFGDRVKFIKVDVDQHDALANQLGIRALPTLMLYRDGQPVEHINMLTRARIETLLTEQLA
jgi:thioredoxin 1